MLELATIWYWLHLLASVRSLKFVALTVFAAKHIVNRQRNMGGSQTEVFEQFVGFAGFTKMVAHADTPLRRRMFFAQQFGDGATQTAIDLRFLGRNYDAGFANAL